jgi:hypothetical protein
MPPEINTVMVVEEGQAQWRPTGVVIPQVLGSPGIIWWGKEISGYPIEDKFLGVNHDLHLEVETSIIKWRSAGVIIPLARCSLVMVWVEVGNK